MATLHGSPRAVLSLAFSAVLLPVMQLEALTPAFLSQHNLGLAASTETYARSFSGFVQKAAYPGDYLEQRNETCSVVSDKYRFIFVKLRRNGGTSTNEVLKGSLCGVFVPERGDENDAYVDHAHPCADKFTLDHNQGAVNDCNLVPPSREKWESYFVFTFVRDPWDRWDSIQRFCNVGEFCTACGTNASGRCPGNHAWDQAGFVMSPSNESYVDFVGHTETLGADLETALSEVDRRYRARTGHGMEWTNLSVMTDAWVNAASGPSNNYCTCPQCISKVADAYERDVDHLGYEEPSCPAAAL